MDDTALLQPAPARGLPDDAGANRETGNPSTTGANHDGHRPAAKKAAAKQSLEPNASRRTILKDLRLGPRRADATHWRCRRLDDDGDRKGTVLSWGDGDGIEVGEWPIKICSSDTISERWGPGRYIVDYMHIDGNGRRWPRGRSRLLHVTGQKGRVPEPAGPGPMVVAPALPSKDGTDSSFSTLFSLLAYLEDRNDKARAAAAAEARVAQERYRADSELQLERERLASKERIAQIEVQARTVPTRGARFDADELAKRIEAVGERVDEALERFEEGAPPSARIPMGAAPPDNTAAIVSALKDTLAPLLSLVVAKLATGATVPGAALPPIDGGGGKDPKGQPN